MADAKIGLPGVTYSFVRNNSLVTYPAMILSVNADQTANIAVFVDKNYGYRDDQVNVPFSELPADGCWSLVQ